MVEQVVESPLSSSSLPPSIQRQFISGDTLSFVLASHHLHFSFLLILNDWSIRDFYLSTLSTISCQLLFPFHYSFCKRSGYLSGFIADYHPLKILWCLWSLWGSWHQMCMFWCIRNCTINTSAIFCFSKVAWWMCWRAQGQLIFAHVVSPVWMLIAF